MDTLKNSFEGLRTRLLTLLEGASEDSNALLMENYKGNRNNLLYLGPSGGISFSIFQPSIAAMVVRGESDIRLLNLPITDASFLYYILCVPLGQQEAIGNPVQIYTVSADVEDMLYIGSRGFDAKLWMFCTAKGVKENRDIFATFIDELALGRMLNGDSLNCCLISSGEAAMGAVRLFNRYEKVPFMSNMLICGLDLLN